MSENTAPEQLGSATMTCTSVERFGAATEACEVANHFSYALDGKVILITGVNPKGIGYATAETFVSQYCTRTDCPKRTLDQDSSHRHSYSLPKMLIIAGRSVETLKESRRLLRMVNPNVEIRWLWLDLSSQKGVRMSAEELMDWDDLPQIDVVINSAGIMNLPQRVLSEDGIEMTFATNHVGHFLFTNLIMPKLIESARCEPRGKARIVNVSSLSPTWARMRWSDTNFDKVNKELPAAEQPPYEVHRRWGVVDPESQKYLPLEAYNQSKVANVLYGIGLNKRLYEEHGILSVAVHPGIIKTELGRNAPPETIEAIEAMDITWKTLGAGAATSVLAALDPRLGLPQERKGKENWGSYLVDCQISDRANPLAESSSEAEKLWALSERLVKQKFDWARNGSAVSE